MTQEQILSKLATGEITAAMAGAELDKIRPARSMGKLTFGVAKSGGLSVYNCGQRFPITHYVQQWEAILDVAQDMRAFIKAHATEFTRK